MLKANELRIGNWLNVLHPHTKEWKYERVKSETILNFEKHSDHNLIKENFKPIPLTEDILLKCGFSVITENSAGKRYAYVVNGIYSSDLSFTYWTTTKEKGKFFRGDLQLKSLHQLQNLYFALTGEELTINL